MQVKMRTMMCGPGGNSPPGTVLEVSSADAATLVDGGYAEYVNPTAEDFLPENDDAPETAAMQPVAETAVAPQPKRKRGRPRKVRTDGTV